MRAWLIFMLPILVAAPALGGPEYTAEDVIRYFEQVGSVETTASSDRAPHSDTELAALPGDHPDGDPPLIIPMTGAKAGFHVERSSAALPPPAAPSTALSSPAPPSGSTAGYDLLVTFELDSAMLTAQAQKNLDIFARALATPALSKLRFVIEGHTDSSGSREHNMKLSQARAVSVVAYLVERGVNAGRLKAEGHGPTRPRFSDSRHPENRRVETRRID